LFSTYEKKDDLENYGYGINVCSQYSYVVRFADDLEMAVGFELELQKSKDNLNTSANKYGKL